ncbi:MAG: type II toxin-antitoxin system VapC family toxin [Aggregatilineales bacterium]
MIVAVIDTHAVIWYLHDNPKLSAQADQFISAAAQVGNKIAISSISLIETVYLIEKGRISVETLSTMARILRTHDGIFEEVLVNLDIARTLNRVDAAKVPDMPDRIIAATALQLNVPVISKDSKIQLSGLQTIW